MEITNRDSVELGLLAAEWVCVEKQRKVAQQQSDCLYREAEAIREKLLNKLRVLRGCTEEQYKEFVRYQFDIKALEETVHGRKAAIILAELLR